jgi:hypothetical protein
MTDYVDF